MTIKPNENAFCWQADQIAECLGVSETTYAELWNKIVPLYDAKPRGECPGEFVYPISDYWGKLSPEAQADVNHALENI